MTVTNKKSADLELETKPVPFLFCMLFSWMSWLNNLVFFFDRRVPVAPTSHLFVLYWIFWEDFKSGTLLLLLAAYKLMHIVKRKDCIMLDRCFKLHSPHKLNLT